MQLSVDTVLRISAAYWNECFLAVDGMLAILASVRLGQQLLCNKRTLMIFQC